MCVIQLPSLVLHLWQTDASRVRQHPYGGQCSVEGCKAGRGHGCTHVTTQCVNCKGPHGARADTCAAKKEARQLAWGWKSPPRPRREKGAKAPEAPEDETPATQQEAGEEVDTEVEMEVEPTPEGTAE